MLTNAEKFAKNKFVMVKNVISPGMVNLVTQYAIFDEMQNLSLEKGPTPQIHNSHSSYADPLMESLLLSMHSVMEENTGLTLYPTYSYYRVYRPGAILKSHVDRPSCEISTTITLGFDYKDKSDYEWPIFVGGAKCAMESGDIVIYRGCDVDHWRDEFVAPVGSYHAQVFLHYVDVNGPNASCKFDQRPCIGYKKPEAASQLSTKSYLSFTE
jgi:hypothetical protein